MDATTAAQKLLAALSAPFSVDEHAVDVGASIGTAQCPEHGVDASTLLRRADIAMYVAKQDHSGVAVYSSEQDLHSTHRLALMSDLRHALAHDELALYYQPTVAVGGSDDPNDAPIQSVEALLRWHHAEHGFIPQTSSSRWPSTPVSWARSRPGYSTRHCANAAPGTRRAERSR